MTAPILPALPEPDFENHDNGDVFGCEKTYYYTAKEMQAYATAAVIADRADTKEALQKALGALKDAASALRAQRKHLSEGAG